MLQSTSGRGTDIPQGESQSNLVAPALSQLGVGLIQDRGRSLVHHHSRMVIASLALLGFSSGCTSKSVHELIAERPEATPAQVLKDGELWLNKEVTIRAKPVLIDDRSKLQFVNGDYSHLHIQLDLRYRLETEQDGPATDLILIDYRKLSLDRVWFDPKNIAADFVLPTSTFVVSGQVSEFQDSNQLYLRYLQSMYSDEAGR